MGGFHVVPDDVSQVAAQMADINQGIDAQMNQLLSQLSALSDLWRGPAATSFHEAKSNWAARAAEHNRRLSQISANLMQTHRDYVTSEVANRMDLQGAQSIPRSSDV